MIQRIQTIYLLLTAIGMGTLFGFPFASASATPNTLFADGVLDLNDNLILKIGTIVIIVLSVLAILLFRNRVLQINVGKLNMLLILGLLGTVAYFVFTSTVSFTVGLGLFVPVLALILQLMANKAISKDKKLVDSMDRLR